MTVAVTGCPFCLDTHVTVVRIVNAQIVEQQCQTCRKVWAEIPHPETFARSILDLERTAAQVRVPIGGGVVT